MAACSRPQAEGDFRSARVWLSQRIRTDDLIIRGLVAELAERKLKVDYHSAWDFVDAEKLSFKTAWSLASAIVPTWPGGKPGVKTIKTA